MQTVILNIPIARFPFKNFAELAGIVSETVKVLNEIRHQPASPVMRRAHQQPTYHQQVVSLAGGYDS
jgi:hypothetical protein